MKVLVLGGTGEGRALARLLVDEQGVQLGPKWDAAQASHDEPVKPALHVQVPAEVQVPPVSEQGVEQEVLWRETRERRPLMLEEDGSCERSGMES